MSILTADQLRDKWNEYSEPFATFLEKNYYHLAVNMVMFLLEACPREGKLLEIGCGAGGGTYLVTRYFGDAR